MMWRLLAPGGIQDYWRHPEFDELGNAARLSLDEKFRGEAYRKMTRIFFEHNPWIIVIQPFEDYGLQKYVEFTPNSNQSVRDPALQPEAAARLAPRRQPAGPGVSAPGPAVLVHARLRRLPRLPALSDPHRALARLDGRVRGHAAVGGSGPAPAATRRADRRDGARPAGPRARPADSGAVRHLPGQRRPRGLRTLDPLPPAGDGRGALLSPGDLRAGPDGVRHRGRGRVPDRRPVGRPPELAPRPRDHGSGARRAVGADLLHRHPVHPDPVAPPRPVPDLGAGRLAPSGAPRAHAGRLHHGLDRADHALGRARGPAGGLRPDRPGEGRDGALGGGEAHPQERGAADPHDHRPPVRDAARRRGGHGDGIRLAGDRPARDHSRSTTATTRSCSRRSSSRRCCSSRSTCCWTCSTGSSTRGRGREGGADRAGRHPGPGPACPSGRAARAPPVAALRRRRVRRAARGDRPRRAAPGPAQPGARLAPGAAQGAHPRGAGRQGASPRHRPSRPGRAVPHGVRHARVAHDRVRGGGGWRRRRGAARARRRLPGRMGGRDRDDGGGRPARVPVHPARDRDHRGAGPVVPQPESSSSGSRAG